MAAQLVNFPPGALRGSVAVPGDKSISHRALIAGAAGTTPLQIANLNPGRDVRATREALIALGAHVRIDGNDAEVDGGRLLSPPTTLDCMNSGTTARMLLGACAGANAAACFDGDSSLRRRPMEPVAAQLRAFGAKIETTDGRLPLRVRGTPEIQTRHFILLAPSAQVKSALIFAGLFAGVSLTVDGDRSSRDHTERLLAYLGAEIEWDGRSVRLGPSRVTGGSVTVAGDVSAAAFFVTGAAITPGSSVCIRDVGVNPTRTGLLDALRCMGAAIELRNERTVCGEPVADVAVEYRPLQGAAIDAGTALRAIDEVPLIAIAAAFAAGTTTVAGISELRTKESDRINAIERLLEAVGIESSYDRGALRVTGGEPAPRQAAIRTEEDHRIIMAAAVLACAAGPLSVDGAGGIEVSFPGFQTALTGLQRG
jgi:3-phosphoshikimate 1-carboxyvinyltransferase